MASDYVTRMTTITCPCIHPAVHHQQHTCVMTSELISFARLITYTDTHCKKCPYIHGYSVASFPRFNGTAVPCTFVSDGIIGGTLQCGFIIPSIYGYRRMYGTGSVKIRKTRHEMSVDVRIFFCSAGRPADRSSLNDVVYIMVCVHRRTGFLLRAASRHCLPPCVTDDQQNLS